MSEEVRATGLLSSAARLTGRSESTGNRPHESKALKEQPGVLSPISPAKKRKPNPDASSSSAPEAHRRARPAAAGAEL